MSDQELGPERAYQHEDEHSSEHEPEHSALRAYFAARAEDIHPSPELAGRVAAIRPPSSRRWPSPRLSVPVLGGLALAGAAAFVLLAGHPTPGPDRPSPLAPPTTGVPAAPQSTANTSATPDHNAPPAPSTGRTGGPAIAPPSPPTAATPGHSAPPAPPSSSGPASPVTSPTSSPVSPVSSTPGAPGSPGTTPPSASAPTPIVPSTHAPPTMSGP